MKIPCVLLKQRQINVLNMRQMTWKHGNTHTCTQCNCTSASVMLMMLISCKSGLFNQSVNLQLISRRDFPNCEQKMHKFACEHEDVAQTSALAAD